MSIATCAAWAAVTFLWNAANSCNSRGKNSRSLAYNGVTTLITSALYLTSLLWIGNLLVQQTSRATFLAVVAAYAVLSTAGSIAGQEFALKFLGKVEHHE